ncbi:GntR family transcriptional regulator [Roseburia hominis]
MNEDIATEKEVLLNRRNATTLSEQLKDIIYDKIRTGEWKANEMIPSENKLSEMYGISRMTARGVITQFVSQGILHRIPGKGTFVSDTKLEVSTFEYSGVRGQLEEQGHSVRTKLISCEKMRADDFVSGKLGIRMGEEHYVIKRVRYANEIPISFHESYVPVKLCPDLEENDLENGLLCRIMRANYHLNRSRMVETLESYSADREKAKYLDIKPGFSLILLQDKLFTAENVLYEYSRVFFRGDKIKISIEYRD